MSELATEADQQDREVPEQKQQETEVVYSEIVDQLLESLAEREDLHRYLKIATPVQLHELNTSWAQYLQYAHTGDISVVKGLPFRQVILKFEYALESVENETEPFDINQLNPAQRGAALLIYDMQRSPVFQFPMIDIANNDSDSEVLSSMLEESLAVSFGT